MAPAMKMLEDIPNLELAPESTSLQALISSLKDTNLTDIDSETGKQLFHSSMTIFSEEFTVFLGYHNIELISALCNWYDCRTKWEYKTIKRGKEKIDGVWVNLIGGTTPDLIRSSLPHESIGGGLTSRIIFIYEESSDKLVTIPTETPEEQQLFEMLTLDLEQISLWAGEFRWTADFVHKWDAWCREAAENPPFHDAKFDGYIGRRRVHLMKLSMIMAAAHGRNGLVLTADDLEDAITALYEAENKMPLVFKGVGRSDIADLIFRANMFFRMSKTDEIPYSEFARYFEGDADRFTLDRLLDTLEATRTAVVIRKPSAESVIKIIK